MPNTNHQRETNAEDAFAGSFSLLSAPGTVLSLPSSAKDLGGIPDPCLSPPTPHPQPPANSARSIFKKIQNLTTSPTFPAATRFSGTAHPAWSSEVASSPDTYCQPYPCTAHASRPVRGVSPDQSQMPSCAQSHAVAGALQWPTRPHVTGHSPPPRTPLQLHWPPHCSQTHRAHHTPSL